MKRLVAFLAILTLLIAGCGQQTVEQTTPSTTAAAPVQQVDAGLNSLDNLSQELNFSDLDSLDQELNFG